MSVARVEWIKKELNTVLLDTVLLMVILLSPSIVSPALNTVIDPSVLVLIQVIVGKGVPSAEQFRKSCSGLRSWMTLGGEIIILG